MFNFSGYKLPLVGLVFLCCAGMAQADTCGANGLMACDLEVNNPQVGMLMCGTAPASLIYTIRNNTPSAQGFSYSVASTGLPVIGTVTITGTTCSGTFTPTQGTGLLPSMSACTVTLAVQADSEQVCRDGESLNWEFVVDPNNPRLDPIERPIDPVQTAPINPPDPPMNTCTGVPNEDAPLCRAKSFCVLGQTAVKINGNVNQDDTYLQNNCNVGVATGTTMEVILSMVEPSGTINVNNSAAQNAQTDLGEAMMALLGLGSPDCTAGTSLADGVNLVGSLAPGLYCIAGDAKIDGTLNLSGIGDYYFLIAGKFEAKVGSKVILASGADADKVFWVVSSPATNAVTILPGDNGNFQGNILAVGEIRVDNRSSINSGRALSRAREVVLKNAQITKP